VLVTKVTERRSPVLDEVRRVVAKWAPAAPVLAARLEPVSVRRPQGASEPAQLEGARVLAAAALGRPGGFAELLRAAGAEVVETRWFADHHRFTAEELAMLTARADELDAMVATTAKDAVKMPGNARVWVVEVRMVPLDGSWDPLWRLLPGLEP
jgi:tetraacyldisaccharide 4'-kinase